jgi:hypothetical protein
MKHQVMRIEMQQWLQCKEQQRFCLKDTPFLFDLIYKLISHTSIYTFTLNLKKF